MPLNIDWQQILLHMLNFAILFAILYFLLYKPVKKFMDDRERTFREREEKSKNELAAAEQMMADYERKMREATEEIEARKQSACAQAEKEIAARKQEIDSQAQQLLYCARKDAERERQEMIAGAQKEIMESAAEMAARILSRNTSQTYDQFLDAAEREKPHE